MTREEATMEAARRNREDPTRDRYSWLPREGADRVWTLARIGLPGHGRLIESMLAGEPAPRDDVRPPLPPDQIGFG